MFKMSRFSLGEAVGMAKRIWSIWYFFTADRMLSRPPTMGTPSMNRPHLLELSSMTQQGLAAASVELFSSFRMTCPAAPAPITMAFFRGLAFFSRRVRSRVMYR